jgi:serine/threonine protein kinase
MASIPKCPDEPEILAVAAGDEVADELRRHLDECSRCSELVQQYRSLVGAMRNGDPGPACAAATAGEPASDPTRDIGDGNHGAVTAASDLTATTEVRRSATDTDLEFGCGADGESLPVAIGKYLVIGRYPRSRQAEVYRVVHPGLAKDLVLKISLNPVRADGRCEIVEEAKILAELEHPNLVRVYDLDFHDERPYMVMEYIRGRTLEQTAPEGRLSSRQAAALLAKVAGAAEYAHRHGIVHRDIKPKNILVDDAGEPRLIDFGMARLRHAWSDDPGSPGGTFAYMAPEQARVESPEERAKVGPASDVFALGAVLYCLLTRQAPFAGETWRASMARARECDFDRKALDGRRVARGLRRICLEAMAADPAERYPSAEALQKALNRFVLRPKFEAVAAGIVGLVVVAGLTYARYASRPEAASLPSPDVAPQTRPAAPVALAGDLIVHVRNKKDGRDWELDVRNPATPPLLVGDGVHLEARLNQPAHTYLLWLDSEGKVIQLFPRNDDKYGNRPSGDQARDVVQFSAALIDWLVLEGSGGLETVMLLARRTPLAPNTSLAALVGKLPPSKIRRDLNVAILGFDEGRSTEALGASQ